MNIFVDFEVLPDDRDFIISIKKQIDLVYENQSVFGFSLETLELTRRFNQIFSLEEDLTKLNPFDYNRLLSISRHLERNLVQEIK